MKEEALRTILAPVLESVDLELEAVEVVSAGRRKVVRVVVDGDGESGRGPNLDEIAAASKLLSAALDAADTGPAPYTLEVSSRGVNRPLTTPAHWRRNEGRLVRIERGDDASPVTGRIRSADDEAVVLLVDDAEQTFAFGDVVRALVQVELNRSAVLADSSEEE
jgi:ribosome maturation factor RimP